MSRRLHPPLRRELADENAERVRQSHEKAIEELQGIQLLRGKLIKGIELPNATNVTVAHGLGHRATVIPGVPYAVSGAVTTGGIIRDRTRLVNVDYDQYFVLYADGWGTTMYVDVWVF